MLFWVGGGRSEWFGLPGNHRFAPAFFHHDAESDALKVYQGKKKWSQVEIDKNGIRSPMGYKDLVVFEFNRIVATLDFSPKQYLKRSDRKFLQTMIKLSRNETNYLLQAHLYYRIARINSVLSQLIR